MGNTRIRQLRFLNSWSLDGKSKAELITWGSGLFRTSKSGVDLKASKKGKFSKIVCDYFDMTKLLYLIRHKIKYTQELQDIIAFIESSANCRQFTRIDCHNMGLYFDSEGYFGYLVDRYGNRMNYIGGGPSNGRGKVNYNLAPHSPMKTFKFFAMDWNATGASKYDQWHIIS